MAKIIQTSTKRRMIKISTDDVITVVTHFQTITNGEKNYEAVRNILESNEFYLPEDV